MFTVEVVLDDQLKGKAWLRVTHNGNSWSSLPLNSQDEVSATIKALQNFSGLTQRAVDEAGLCANCSQPESNHPNKMCDAFDPPRK